MGIASGFAGRGRHLAAGAGLASIVALHALCLAGVASERRTLGAIARSLVPAGASQGEIVRTLARHVRDEVHHSSRAEVERMPLLRRWNYLYHPFGVSPLTVIQTGGHHRGACGSSTQVLMEMLREFGIDSRFVLLLGDDLVSRHTVLEVFYAGKWGAVDPLYNIVYTHADGTPAAVPALRHDETLFLANAKSGWEYGYGPKRKERPHAYNADKLAFRNAYYFNFGKLGFVTGGLYYTLRWAFGEQGPLLVRRPNFYAYPTLTTLAIFDAGLGATGATLLVRGLLRKRRRREFLASG